MGATAPQGMSDFLNLVGGGDQEDEAEVEGRYGEAEVEVTENEQLMSFENADDIVSIERCLPAFTNWLCGVFEYGSSVLAFKEAEQCGAKFFWFILSLYLKPRTYSVHCFIAGIPCVDPAFIIISLSIMAPSGEYRNESILNYNACF